MVSVLASVFRTNEYVPVRSSGNCTVSVYAPPPSVRTPGSTPHWPQGWLKIVVSFASVSVRVSRQFDANTSLKKTSWPGEAVK